MSSKLLAFKRSPTVELRIEDLGIEVRDNRVVLATPENEFAWFSWDEWRDLAARIEHSMKWIEKHTPDDVTGRSFEVVE